MSVVLALAGIAKRYGGIMALDGVDLALRPGEVVGLAGDIGAGKTTLIRIIAGAVPPTRGTISVHGEPVVFRGPEDALARGIAAIHQDLALAPRLAVADNVFMGAELTRRLGPLRVPDRAAMRAAAAGLLARLGQPGIDVAARAGALSGGQRQAVALARALARDARIVALDEPTAALGIAESAAALDMMRALRAAGAAVLLASHRLDHIAAVADRVVVLARGRVAHEVSGATIDDLAYLIESSAS